MIRELPVPALKSFIREDTAGTALAHLAGGPFEAHARDEAGWDAEGHKQMWDAARDAALSNPEVSPQIFAWLAPRRKGFDSMSTPWQPPRFASGGTMATEHIRSPRPHFVAGEGGWCGA